MQPTSKSSGNLLEKMKTTQWPLNQLDCVSPPNLSAILYLTYFTLFPLFSDIYPLPNISLSKSHSLIRETHFKVHFTSVSGEGRLCLLSPWKLLHSTVCFSSTLLNPPGENLSLLPITTWNPWTQLLQSHVGIQQRGKYRTGHTFKKNSPSIYSLQHYHVKLS